MCRPTACGVCGKTGWAGCGQHVDQVMRGVARADRCTCTTDSKAQRGPSLLSRLFGR